MPAHSKSTWVYSQPIVLTDLVVSLIAWAEVFYFWHRAASRRRVAEAGNEEAMREMVLPVYWKVRGAHRCGPRRPALRRARRVIPSEPPLGVNGPPDLRVGGA